LIIPRFLQLSQFYHVNQDNHGSDSFEG